MTKGFMITHVSCEGCKQALDIPPLFVLTEDDIENVAVELHGKTKIICATPKLIAIYASAMVADELVPPKAPVIATNGNGH